MRIKRLDIGLIMKTILEWTAEILSYNGKPLMGFKCKNDQIISENFSLVNCSFYIHYPAIWVNIFVSSFIYF